MNEHNAKLTQGMIDYIAERSGEDRATVFLDIIIHFIFSNGKNVHLQQQIINDIAAVYGVQAPALKTGPGDDDIPF